MRPRVEPIEPREGSPGADVPLSIRIRTATSNAHRDLETRTGWPETLGGARDVSAMLQMFRALHRSLDAARKTYDLPLRQHGFGPGPIGATASIDEDLRTLGVDRLSNPAGLAACADFDAALGLHYVAAGSAMGNMLILRHIAAHPDPLVVAATRFLRLSSGRAVPEFRAFRAALDAYGHAEPAHRVAVIEGANAAFRACAAWLDADAAG